MLVGTVIQELHLVENLQIMKIFWKFLILSFIVFKKRRGEGAFDATPQSRDGQKSPV